MYNKERCIWICQFLFFLQLNIYQYIIYFNEKLIKYITAAVRTVQIQVHCIA